MSLWKIAWRSIQQRSLASALTAVSMALGVALVVTVLVIYGVVDASFRRNAQGYNLIVGPKGSSLDLVLNTVYHLGRPVGTIPYKVYEELDHGQFASEVEVAIPIAVGDNYKGYRIVGTIPEMFTKLEYLGGRKYAFAQGQNFDPKVPTEAVVGATVARKAGLKLNDTFRPMHGVDIETGGSEHEPFRVVGILAPTGTPNDRVLFVNIAGFEQMHAGQSEDEEEDEDHAAHAKAAPAGKKEAHASDPHANEKTPGATEKQGAHEEHGVHEEHGEHQAGQPEKRGEQAQPAAATPGHEEQGHLAHYHADAERKLTAVLVVSDESRMDRVQAMFKWLNDEPYTQAVRPAEVIAWLFENLIGHIEQVLLILAVLIVIVAGIGILVSIYNSMNDRRHEIAIMRALGARRSTVMTIILLEAILLSLGGGALGLLLGHGLVAALSPFISEYTGVAIGVLHFEPMELILVPGLIVLASLVGYLPAVIAYRTDVARSLVAHP